MLTCRNAHSLEELDVLGGRCYQAQKNPDSTNWYHANPWYRSLAIALVEAAG